MKITKIECIPVSMKFSKPMVMSIGSIPAADSVVVKIHTDAGITGVAETGDTSVWYMGDSQDSIMHLITRVYGPQVLLGEDPFKIEKIVARMDKSVKLNQHSKAVIDYALHDLVGKALNTPVYNLLGGLSNERIPLCFVMSSDTPEVVAEDGANMIKAGFRSLKLKVGLRSLEEDVELVAALRGAVGGKVQNHDRCQRRMALQSGAEHPEENGKIRHFPLRTAACPAGIFRAWPACAAKWTSRSSPTNPPASSMIC